MSQVNEKVMEVNGINLHLVPSKKFKTISFVAKFKAPLHRNTITERALLPYVMQQGTKLYPNLGSLHQKLDDLYGATFSIDGTKKGNFHIITIRLEVPNQRYIKNESSLVDQTIELLNEIITKPNVSDNSFDTEIVEREKETLKQKINSIMDDKMSYANMRLIEEMCENELYQTSVYGYIDDLPQLNGEKLYLYYQSLLKEDRMDLYVLGDFEEDDMTKSIKTIIKKEKLLHTETELTDDINKVSEPKTVIEKQLVQQAKLHIGYRTNCTYRDELYGALQVFNGMFGGFPNSKLFINVREKSSLAYYAASRIESHKGLMLVFSGIAPTDFQQAKSIINEQINAMKSGDFTEDEINSTKEQIINKLLETLDHPLGVIELLYQQVVANFKLSPIEFIENIKKVEKKNIIEVAQQIEEDTTYLLTNKGDE
ncbi:EF-P 5-aminopentanol modification-associated protein YfmF [Virgibacillus flavescens]|uniref:EF-P 5-aminopentanol modification-associated protein YfmF n=1 Tax=Virgibacillus flavescens TaxID=1611422 RepID=UPI003D356661